MKAKKSSDHTGKQATKSLGNTAMKAQHVNHLIAPEWITELSMCEVFVFGSNLEGQHHGGAARMAYERFGAEWGVGDGPTGRCYAIPTMHGGLEAIQPYVDKFIDYAVEHPMQRFLMTRVGCGIAGLNERQMALLFERAYTIPNIALPEDWRKFILVALTADAMMGGSQPIVDIEHPSVVNEHVLNELCQKYLYQIGAGIKRNLPNIPIRYVKAKGEFGYAKFGDYLQFGEEGGMFVWETDEQRADEYNQEIVESVFEDECKGRGVFRYVLFAGAATPFKDVHGDRIYTGDILRIFAPHSEYILAVGGISYWNGEGAYGCILDNHSLLLEEALQSDYQFERVGTVFYQLSPHDDALINTRVAAFNSLPLSKHPLSKNSLSEDLQNAALVKAKFTPNFDQEDWKYQALDMLGAEFNWRK